MFFENFLICVKTDFFFNFLVAVRLSFLVSAGSENMNLIGVFFFWNILICNPHLEGMPNKTASLHRHSFLICVFRLFKNVFEGKEAFSFSKKQGFFIKVFNFSCLPGLMIFLPKNLTIRPENMLKN